MKFLKTAKFWIILGLCLRLISMPFTYHPDLHGHYLGGWFMAKKGALLTMYDYISRLPRTDKIVKIYGDDFFVYSPLTYWLHAAWLTVASPVIDWNLFEKFEIDYDTAATSPNLPWLIFVLKIPYLLADIGLLILLRKYLSPKYQNLITALWAINIPMLHSGFLMGQFDVFIALGITAALVATQKKHSHWPSVFLALAAAFKPFPLFILPFLPGKWWQNLAVGLSVYALIISPYALTSPAYRMYALSAQQSSKIWDAKIPVSATQSVVVFFALLVLGFWLKQHTSQKFSPLLWLGVPLMIFYSFTHFHPQWFTWISPLLLLLLILYPKSRLPLLAIVGCWLIITFSFEPSLHTGLFGYPINFKPWLNDQVLSFVRSVLAASFAGVIISAKASE